MGSIGTGLLSILSWPVAGAALLAAQEAPPAPANVGVLGAAEPLLVTDYHVDVLREGPAYQASTVVVLRNPRSTAVEGVALIPVPESAIPRGFLAENGDVRMKGVVRSRERAVDVYRGITRSPPADGKDPAILERLGDRWLRATVSPVPAFGQVRLVIGYLGFTEKLGGLRELQLPSERTALRGSWAGSSRRLLAGEWSAGPIATWCFRAPGADGAFCVEIDPSALLEKALPGATYLLVLETPESTGDELADAGGAVLAELVRNLRPEDRVELYGNGSDAGFFGAPRAADETTRDRLAAELQNVHSRGWGHLDQRLNAALVEAGSVDGPVRIVVASAQRRVASRAELVQAVTRAAMRNGFGFGLFTCALGTRADASALADLAQAGRGRAFALLSAGESRAIAPPLVAAARRPVLVAPQASVAGAAELVVERKRHVTYGETLRIVGRYPEGMTALVRLEGHVLDETIDAMWETALDDENVAHPWVATTWAGLRARELRGKSAGEESLAYLVRLAERFSLIGAETVALGLEPALEGRLPPLIGTPETPVAQLDAPERPTPPAQPESAPADPRDRRPPPVGPSGPGQGGGPIPSRPPPSIPPVAPAPGPPAPSPIPGGRGGQRGGH